MFYTIAMTVAYEEGLVPGVVWYAITHGCSHNASSIIDSRRRRMRYCMDVISVVRNMSHTMSCFNLCSTVVRTLGLDWKTRTSLPHVTTICVL